MGCVNEGCCSVWRIVQSVLGILLGLLSGTAFFWQYGNYQAAAWAFASALVATGALHLAILLYRKTTNEWYHPYHLHTIQLMAFITADISVAAFAWYLFYAAYYHIPMMPADTSAVITSVWAGMTAKWAMFLWLFARRCVRQIRVDDELE